VDGRTGGLVVETRDETGTWVERIVYPFGHYVSWGSHLSRNLSMLDAIKAEGYTVIHPVPDYPVFQRMDAMNAVFRRCEELNLLVQFDMRHSFRNATLVSEQVSRYKGSPALLGWYTADEPDGTSDPPSAVSAARTLLRDLDAYHPTALVLNCRDFGARHYAAGADVVMADIYPIGINATFSRVWGTPCVPRRFGCCGYPTAAEERAMVYSALALGAPGILFWIRPSAPDLGPALAALARETATLGAPWLLSRATRRAAVAVDGAGGLVVGAWEREAGLRGAAVVEGEDDSGTRRVRRVLLVVANVEAEAVDSWRGVRMVGLTGPAVGWARVLV
ncbi:hypothetical protein HK405_015990, partial [Cladochytrium tenue]